VYGVDRVVTEKIVVEQFPELVSVPIDNCVGDGALPPVCSIPRGWSAVDNCFGRLGAIYVFLPEIFMKQSCD